MNGETMDKYATVLDLIFSRPPMSNPTANGTKLPTPPQGRNLSVPSGALLVDCDGKIHFAACDGIFLGAMPPSTFIGVNIDKIFDVLLSPSERRELTTTVAAGKTGNSFSFVYDITGPPPRFLTLTGHPYPVRDSGNGWLLIIQDITACCEMRVKMVALHKDIETMRQTEQRELDEVTASLIETNVELRKEIRDHRYALEKLSVSEARFRDLTETTSDFIWEINSAGNYTYASPKSIKLLGLEPWEIIGTPLFLLRKIESASSFIKNIELRGQPQFCFSKMEYTHTRRDGLEVTVESSGEPIFNKHNEFLGFRGIDRDVTERRIYETELKRAIELAESANLAKSEFLANMSHELRTPLHAILSFAGYGEKRIESTSRKELFRFFSQITTSGQRLLPLIDSLLNLAKLESGKMSFDFQHRDLMAEIRSAIHEITPLAERNGLFIKFAPDNVATIASFDQPTIAQVIRNLLANAVKFSAPQTTITVFFDTLEDINKKRFLNTTISNYGVTIPANELSIIFDKFAQSSKTRTGAGGTGLGLSICKKIIGDHGGTIWASHGENGDTRFHFTLPIQRML